MKLLLQELNLTNEGSRYPPKQLRMKSANYEGCVSRGKHDTLVSRSSFYFGGQPNWPIPPLRLSHFSLSALSSTLDNFPEFRVHSNPHLADPAHPPPGHSSQRHSPPPVYVKSTLKPQDLSVE